MPPPSDDLFETWGKVMGHFRKGQDVHSVAGEHLWWWAGDSCASADKKARKLAEQLQFKECTPWTIIPKEQDLMARRNYRASDMPASAATRATKKRKVGSFQEHTMDRIDIFSAERLELDEVTRTWIPSVDWITAQMPILAPVPLLHPNDILHVSASQKSRVMMGAPRANILGVKVAVDDAPLTEEDKQAVILYHGDRHPHTYAESFKIFNVGRAVFLTVGNGTGIKGALLSRTRCTAVFNKALHQKLVLEDSRPHPRPITI